MSDTIDRGSFSLSHLLIRAARINADGIATIYRERETTWAAHQARVAATAILLKAAGICSGDRVAILAPNSDLYIEAVYGVIWAGAIVVPLNTRLSPGELAANLADAGCGSIIVSEATRPFAEQAVAELASQLHLFDIERMQDDAAQLPGDGDIADPPAAANSKTVAAIVYSGGTTGRSKGIMIGHDGIIINALQSIDELELRQESRWLHNVPMFHIAGIGHTVAIAAKAATHVIAEKFDPVDTLDLIERRECTHLALVPTMVAMLVDAAKAKPEADLKALRYIQYGGAPMPDSVLSAALDLWRNVRFVQFFGQTESGPIITALPPRYHEPGSPKLRSVGRPVPTYAVEIRDEADQALPVGRVGEIVGRSPSAMLGYWNQPDLTAEVFRGGWLHTGDAGYLDEDGFLYIADRIKDIIISGGENIYSSEVEQALYAHPAVEQCAVVGTADPLWGERVHAFVKLKERTSVDPEALTEHCRTVIARYKVPRSYTIVRESLPLSPAGKILKAELRKLVMETAG